MTPVQVKLALKSSIASKRPVFLWGPPGVGKSAVVAETAKENGMEIIDLRAALFDPIDLRGIPYLNGDETSFAIPDFLPKDPDSEGLFFVDELNQAAPAVQGAFYQLILDRKLGMYELPKGWAVIAAGNRETDRGIAHRMPAPLANRFASHIDFEVRLQDWTQWALDNGIKTEVLQFLRFRPALLHKFDKDAKAFPTPRTWEFVSDSLGTLDPDIEYEFIKGCIGEGAASEFFAFIQIYRDLPDPDGVLLNPSQATVPTDVATMYALSGALTERATEANMDAFTQYTNRCKPEFQALMMKDCVRRKSELAETKAFNNWVIKNADTMG